MIELKNLQKAYQTTEKTIPILKGISLQIAKGEKVALIGKSGSGKTTLLNMITGIDSPDKGQIFVNQHPLHTYNESKLATWRGAEVGIVFQFYHLFDTLSILDNIRFPMELLQQWSAKEQKERAFSLLKKVGLGGMENKFPHQLSGGEKQRVAIARALANDPPLIVADEPTGNLDSLTTAQIKALFNQVYQEGKTLLIITHEAIIPEEYDRVLRLQDGDLVN